MLELDGGRYARGDVHYNDMCYFIAASRAAIRASKRVVKCPSSIKKTSHKKYVLKAGTQRQRKRCPESAERSGAITVRCTRRKRRVVSGQSRMTQMRSNRSYLPGD